VETPAGLICVEGGDVGRLATAYDRLRGMVAVRHAKDGEFDFTE
jgi:hypothetical protein